MKRLNNFSASLLHVFALLVGVSAAAANLPSDWQREQSFDVSTTGLVKMSLPVETLDAARPALEDLRLYDDAGNEVPYLIERPAGRESRASGKIISGFAQRKHDRHHARNGTGAAARRRHAGKSGDGFYQSRAR